MKAKCPHCQTGCDKCTGGFIEVQFPDNERLYARKCWVCGFENGGRFVPANKPDIQGDLVRLMEKHSGQCLRCDNPDVVWELIGEVE